MYVVFFLTRGLSGTYFAVVEFNASFSRQGFPPVIPLSVSGSDTSFEENFGSVSQHSTDMDIGMLGIMWLLDSILDCFACEYMLGAPAVRGDTVSRTWFH